MRPIAEPRDDVFVAQLTLDALAQRGHVDLGLYAQSLTQACAAHPPPYGQDWYGQTYRDLAVDPEWLANSLIANAVKEGYGSRKLWELVARIGDPDLSEQVRVHAIDESRHALIYIALLELAFPEAVGDEATRQQLRALSPQYGSADRPAPTAPAPLDHVFDEIVQMNIGEIRTRIHQLLMRPVLAAHCPAESRTRLHGMLDALLEDETRHIAYTANIIEAQLRAGFEPDLAAVMAYRLAEFNAITLQEVGEKTFDGG